MQNHNIGFDTPNIKYFSETDFLIVLERVEQHGLGISGIEPWKDGKMHDVLTSEDFNKDSKDPSWYWEAFKQFQDKERGLLYAATYVV
ncbi:MAG: hypothetical protein HRT74_06340 [Flavobacteriales bacterium]|nr:hypothetical protein [Flavobacteriales bacterium]